METLDLYDENRLPTGKTARRGEALPPGGLHMVVHVCLFDRQGRMLIQQRQICKSAWPGKWDLSAGGCAQAGETSRQAAQRETREELGLDIDLQGVRPSLTVNFSSGFDDLYLVEREVDLRRLRLQREEVQNVAWASQSEVLEMLESGAFIPYRRSLMELLFDMRGKMGMLPVPWPENS